MSTGHDPERTPDIPLDDASGAEAGAGVTGAEASLAGRGPASPAGASSAGMPGSRLVFDDPLDRVSADDTDRGWGGSSVSAADDDFTRFLNEKPPHHL